MSQQFIKNIKPETVLPLALQVDYLAGQIVSKTLVQNKACSMTLFSFDKGEEISTHESDGDAMVIVLDGAANITVGDTTHLTTAGETIIMPAKIPHAVLAEEPFKMLLIVIFGPAK